jgi:hypothetical protein
MKVAIIVSVIVLIGIVFFVSKQSKDSDSNVFIAKQIKLNNLESVINKLLEGKLEYDFFGITSDGVDCIYFSNDNGKINIEFEVMSNDQKVFVNSFKSFAKKYEYEIVKMTYGNKPQYGELNEAPVYKLLLKGNSYQASVVGIKIMKTIFNKSEMTNFEVVP